MKTWTTYTLAAIALTLLACQPPQRARQPPPTTSAAPSGTATAAPARAPQGSGTSAATPRGGTVATVPAEQVYEPAAHDDPRISRSRGTEGGIVVLWPRIIPSTDNDRLLAVGRAIQDRMVQVARELHPGRQIDIRPSPERVCPIAGCLGASLGALVVHKEGGCAVVLQASRPGRVPATQAVWAGKVALKQPAVPFREPPESQVTVYDFAECSLLGAPGTLETKPVEAVVKAIF